MKLIARIEVEGTPVAKGRPRFSGRGQFVRTYTPQKTKIYEETITLAGRNSMGERSPHSGAVFTAVIMHMPIPKSWAKKKKLQAVEGTIRPTSKPDMDNIYKAITDGLNGVVYEDDSQIVGTIQAMYYAERPSVVVEIYEIYCGER